MSFAILRTEKISTWGKVGGAEKHNHRVGIVPNADPEKTKNNQAMFSSGSLLERVKARIGEQKIRKNGVLAVEVLMTASPEYWKDKTPEQVNSWKEQSLEWAKTFFGGEKNLVDWALHLDETSPHIHAIVVPIDKKGKLNCRSFLSGPEKMSAMQDSYAIAMKGFKLDRGLKKSSATHQEIKRYYENAKINLKSTEEVVAELHEAFANIDKEIPSSDNPLRVHQWVLGVVKKIQKVKNFVENLYSANKTLRKERDTLKNSIQEMAVKLQMLDEGFWQLLKIFGLKPADLKNPRIVNPIRDLVHTHHNNPDEAKLASIHKSQRNLQDQIDEKFNRSVPKSQQRYSPELKPPGFK